MQPPISTPATLTVAIPTYNRNAILAGNLPALLRQLCDDVRVLIVDNHSDTPVSQTLGDLPPGVSIIRNPFNVGGNANILRCFEYCQTPWVWLLADDDEVRPDALATALSDIRRYDDAVYINYSTDGGHRYQRTQEVANLKDLLETADYFGNLLFISSCLFRADAMRPHLDFAYHYSYSCAPHLVAAFLAIQKGGGAVLSHRTIARWDRPETDLRASISTICLGLPTLLELPISTAERRLLTRHLAHFPPISELAHQLVLQELFVNESRWRALETFWEAVGRLPWYWTIRRRIMALAWSLPLLLPRLSWLWMRPLYRWKTGHPTGPHKLRARLT